MARTPLLRMIRRELSRSLSFDPQRREFLKASAAATVALSTTATMAAAAANTSIGIVGAGLAGLTAAYRLSRAGFHPSVFEASERIGGRTLTRYNINADRMFCELGGELVDTNHEDLIALCKELNVGIQSLIENETGEDIYYFAKQYFSSSDMIDPANKTGAFVPLAKRIAADHEGLFVDEKWTDKARRFDALSLHDYLEQSRGEVADWVLNLIDLAYTTEYGLDSKVQPALGLLFLAGTATDKPFSIYGESDEVFRIANGSSSLGRALFSSIGPYGRFRSSHVLTKIAQRTNGKIILGFKSPKAENVEEEFDKVILTLPFTKLRTVEGIDTLGLSDLKLRAIRELGYGTNAKIILGTTSRVWREHTFAKSAVACNGSVYTDLSVQTTWEASRGQKGTARLLVNFLGGKQGEDTPENRIPAAKRDLEEIIPALKNAWDGNEPPHAFWARNPHTLGSYCCPLIGQYTSIVDSCATPELDGTLLFAGEHTNDPFRGFMNGAVQSGNQVAAGLIEAIPAKK